MAKKMDIPSFNWGYSPSSCCTHKKIGNAGEEGKKTETSAKKTKKKGVQQLVRREEISITAIWTPKGPQAPEEPCKFDPNFKGPVHKRNCTDVCCCVIFVIVVLGYIALGTTAWIQGDPRKLIYPTDSHGQLCGQKNTSNADKTILFYFNMLKCSKPEVLINLQCPTTQLCVSKCPDRFESLKDVSKSNNWTYYRQFCKPGLNDQKSASDIIEDEDCPSIIVPSRPFLQRCFPDFKKSKGTLTVANETVFKDSENSETKVSDLKDAATTVSRLLNAKEVGIKICEDYANSWYWILIGLVISMVASFIFILVLRYTGGALLWVIIAGVITAVGYGIWHCYWEYSRLRGKPSTKNVLKNSLQTEGIYLQLSQMWLVFMILLIVIEVVIVIMLIFLRKRLCIAVALLREGNKAIQYIMSTLFYPIITFLLLSICITYCVITAVLLASSGTAVYKVVATDKNCTHANLICNPKTFNDSDIPKTCPKSKCLFAFYGGESVYHRYIIVPHLCNLFVLLWLVNYIIALGQCTLAGAFASYYWALNKSKDIPTCPLYSSFSRAISYHTGSLAFGSLIVSMLQMVGNVLDYLHQKLKGSRNRFTRFLLCCLKCCFWCLEHSIKFINTNAYIMMAIYGKNFCTSSKDAYFLLMRNVIRVTVLDKVTDFLLFLGKLVISGSVGVLAFLFFTHKIPSIQAEVPTLNYYWVPLVTVIFGSYMIAHGFFNVYAMCVDTLFLCFLWDLEVNDGSPERPFYMAQSLRKILNKKKIIK